MSGALFVSTECPTCGAPLDFLEGSNAVQCAHCKSNLLVTGRKQLLSYFVKPKLDIHRGVAKAMLAHKESGHSCRVISPQLYFIPYYRLIGHDFRWEAMPKEKKHSEGQFTFIPDHDPEPALFEAASQWINLIFGRHSLTSSQPFLNERSTDQIKKVLPGQEKIPFKNPFNFEHEVLFQDQYVEKNFIGSQCKEFGVYSLGVRPAVLKLELFGKESLESLGKIVRPDLSPEEAFERGMKTFGGKNLLFRQVLGWTLSLVYFPFWVIEFDAEGEHGLTVLDAVSESLIQLKTPLSLTDSLSRPLTGESKVIQFRPLACPNCGGDLPVRKEDVIFFCDSCKKAWQIMGNDLSEMSYEVISPSTGSGNRGTKHLPFWVIDVDSSSSGVSRYFLPGFRYRRLKTLVDLATALTRKAPSYTLSDHQGLDAFGCFYDQQDAVNLAKVTQAGMSLKTLAESQPFQSDPFSPHKIILSWIPFQSKGDSLIDPFTGISLSQSLLG